MYTFTNNEARIIVSNMIKAIKNNKQYLSDIDGAIGDGDHGINMNKGFTMCEEELNKNPGNFSHSLLTLSNKLMTHIGGSMGPLYGMFFRAMGKSIEEKETIDASDFRIMLEKAKSSLENISEAKMGDKTLMDVLIPSVETYSTAIKNGKDFHEALEIMKETAVKGRDSTINMVAKVGRSSRLGERSKGVMDAGAASCCLILETIADSAIKLIR